MQFLDKLGLLQAPVPVLVQSVKNLLCAILPFLLSEALHCVGHHTTQHTTAHLHCIHQAEDLHHLLHVDLACGVKSVIQPAVTIRICERKLAKNKYGTVQELRTCEFVRGRM